ncbi:hypothetical protein M436DRAFT_66850 [Aureobasidium namibiae CBS 147.97]|uniref:Uncharacterized protein n=1 Tax=Aureobasidium namibiae CBS 147.97 TaxID=1043004 RepID=A0A074WEN8_9PEZI|nr:uncharacterized protein M436DRAFT_66850 [Aureobasidium namibiae CBS 147.97]KEQ70009.1 hypothetical protein M436DRAFT_66850 [Aureobasidium namibiae CBS 147.97]
MADIRRSVTEDGMGESPSILLTRGMMHDSTSETREVQLLEHQGYRGMKVLFLERQDDWLISWIRMAPRLQLATRAWLVRRKVDQLVIGWRELQLLDAVSSLEIHMREIVAATERCKQQLCKEASSGCKLWTSAANKQWKRMKHSPIATMG